MTVIPMGRMAPAPKPWRSRPAMSTGIDQASPHSREAATKTVMPNISRGLRPMTSASLP